MSKTRYLKAAMLATTILACAIGYSQKTPARQTFLWRISGNGLSKPSFLYGTMHLTDRKLFYFGDSLYHYLEQAEGLNIEIDADTMINASVRSWTQNNNGRLLKTLLNKKEYDQYADKLSKTLGKPADKITTRDLWIAKNRKTATAYQKGDMQTIMDLYLYGIARKQGKKVGGIEDIQDQMDVIDDLFDKTDVAYVTSDFSSAIGSVESMKKMYINEDLAGIHLLMEGSNSKRFNDLVLKKRNHKMAERMDSLARQRSSFFAVGVGHLPGDTGVIALLRQKGYAVDPVFSSKKISPEKYAYTTVDRPWIKYTHDLHLYEVEVPGALQPMELAKDKMDMKFYYDVSTAKVYYTAVFNFGIDLSNKDSVFAAMITRMSAENRSLVSQKNIFKQGFEGREVIFKVTGNQLIRVNVFAAGSHGFMAMVLSKESELNDNDSRRFLQSFILTPTTSLSRPYVVYTDKPSAFSIKLPQEPVVTDQDDREIRSGDIKTFSAMDFSSGNSYAIYVGTVKAGNYIPNDSSYFAQVKANLLPSLKKDTVTQRLIHQGYPAMQISGTATAGNQQLKVLSVLRGNRSYLLIAQSNGSSAGDALADSFFHSFVLTNYAETNWNYQDAPDGSFRAWLPAPDKMHQQKSAPDMGSALHDSLSGEREEEEVQNDFTFYDRSTGTTYNVEREILSSYYFTPNDSTLFSEKAADFKVDGDSITNFHRLDMMNDKAADVLLENSKSAIVKKMRLILHGDTLYQVFSYSPRWLVSNENTQKFFNGFKITSSARPSTIFTNKTKKLISDLTSPDSVAFENASNFISNEGPCKSDLKDFYPLLTTPLKDFKESAYNTNNRLVSAISGMADSTTVDYILQHYHELKGDAQDLQYQLLKLLVKMDHSYATASLVKLFHSTQPPHGEISVFSGSLYNQLEVAKALAPEILKMTKDTASALGYAFIIKELIDSNRISRQAVIPYLDNFYKAADQQKKKIKSDDDTFDYNLLSVLDLIGTIGNTQTNAKLQEFSKVNNLDVRYTTVTWLIRNNQPLPANAVAKLASSNMYRSQIYDTLFAVKKAGLFPASELSQRLFAASYVYSSAAADDDPPSGVRFVGDRMADYHGEMQKFYLFDVGFGEGDEASHYLGIAGPFSRKASEVTSTNEATGIYWKEEFLSKEINAKFAAYLKGLDDN